MWGCSAVEQYKKLSQVFPTHVGVFLLSVIMVFEYEKERVCMTYYDVDISDSESILKDRSLGHRAVMSKIPDILEFDNPRASADILWGIFRGGVIIHTPLSLDFSIISCVPLLVPGDKHDVEIVVERTWKRVAHVPCEVWAAGVRPQNRRVAVPESEVSEWFSKKMLSAGFEVVNGDFHCDFIQKGSSPGVHKIPVVSFSGKVRIVDDCANDAVVKGIGRSKNYGCGLMFFTKEMVGHE